MDVAEGSAEERKLVRDWQGFARGWDERMTKACAKAPAAAALDDDLRLQQLLGQACQQLRVATVGAGDLPVPMKHWRESSLEQAAAHIAEARAQLAEAKAF